MSVRMTCEHCLATYKVKARYAGTRGPCPFCGGLIVVPRLPPVPDDQESLHATDETLQNSSLSLTHLQMMPCPACRKNNLVGSPSCFHCGVALDVTQTEI